MDQIVILLVLIGLAFYALERVPFPASPPWLRKAAEIALAVLAIYMLLPRLGISHAYPVFTHDH